MGYYSDVAIECGQKAYKMIKEAAEANRFSPTETFKNDDTNTIIMHWKWVKWYEEFTDVKAINNVLNKLDDLDGEAEDNNWDYSYKITRLGEDPEGDLEIRYSDKGYELDSISYSTFLNMPSHTEYFEPKQREIWLEGYFTETEAKAICAKMEGKTFYNFHCKYSNHAGNCRIGIEVNHIDTDDTIKEMFYFAASGELAKA